jgi:hypothetical protein
MGGQGRRHLRGVAASWRSGLRKAVEQMRSDLVLQDLSPSLHPGIGFQSTNVLRRVRRAL